jgi:hypothetical protein
MTRPLLFTAPALASLVLIAAQAEQKPVYRCGMTYQDSPCPGGKAVDVADERSEAQRKAALDAARNEAEFGSRLQRDRLEEERQRHVTGAANLGAAPKPVARGEPVHKFKPKRKAAKTIKSTLKPMRPPKPPGAAQDAG